MLPFGEIFMDWEDAEHLVGALGGLFEIGVNIYALIKGETEEDEGSEKDKGGLVVTTAEGEVTLAELLTDHEERLTALEKPKRRKRRPTKRSR